MIDHTGVSVSNFEESKKFYTEALKPIGYQLLLEFPASITGKTNVAGFGEPPKADFWIAEGRRTIPAFMSPFESGNVRWLMLFIKARLLPEEKITVPRGSGRITIQTTMAPSSSTRTATTSKSFVTKHRLRPPPSSSPRSAGRKEVGV